MRNSENKKIVWRAAKWSATLLFALFSFFYLYSMQSDLLACYQYILSDGLTSYNPFVGSIIIVVALIGLGELLSYIWSLPAAFVALSYFPSSLLLVLLTGAEPRYNQIVFSDINWTWFALVALLCSVSVYFVRKYRVLFVQAKYSYTDIWPNLAFLFMLFVFIGAAGNTRDTLHDRLKAEQLLCKDKYKDLINIAHTSSTPDSTFVAIKALALAHDGEMANRLFHINQLPNRTNLLITPETFQLCDSLEYKFYRFWGAKPGSYSLKHPDYFFKQLCERHHEDSLHQQKIADYYLCTLLLQRRLEDFAVALPQYYVVNDSLPLHYKEALILYNRMHTSSACIFHDAAVEENYIDFVQMQKECKTIQETKGRLGRAFGKTYWYYYINE